jgi:hypothetical protein
MYDDPEPQEVQGVCQGFHVGALKQLRDSADFFPDPGSVDAR